MTHNITSSETQNTSYSDLLGQSYARIRILLMHSVLIHVTKPTSIVEPYPPETDL